MYPILLQIGSFTLYSLWVMLAIGVFISLLVVNKLEKKRFVELSFLAENSLLIFFCGLILSRITFIIYNLDYYFREGSNLIELFYIWDKGLSIWGGIAGMLISLYILAKKQKEDFFAWTDILITSFSSGAIFINFGAFLDGSNSGNPTELPWGIILENSQYAIPIHPVQIYASIYCLLIFIILFQSFNLKYFKKTGIISLLGITLYGIFRFLEEFMRGDETIMVFGIIREAQIYSLLAFIIGIILLHKHYKKHLKEHN